MARGWEEVVVFVGLRSRQVALEGLGVAGLDPARLCELLDGCEEGVGLRVVSFAP